MRPYDLLLPSRRIPPAMGLDVAVEAERAGWRGVWCSEVLALDTIAFLAAVATRTSRLRLGTAVVPISTRSPALLAMAAATVAGLAPGRFSLGIGVSTPEIVERRHARPVRRPVAETEATLRILRSALRGETVTDPGPPPVDGLRIEPPAEPPPVALAALGPRMTRLATDSADGLMLNLCTTRDAARRAAAARAARGAGYETFLNLRVVVEPSEAEREAAVREATSYARVPAYTRQMQADGFDLDAVVAAGDLPAAMRAMPPGLVDELAVLGSAGECRARIDALAGTGVTPLLLPLGDAASLRRVVAALAP